MLTPMIADSEIGVSTTRISPNSSYSPCVTPNAPPYGPTSSPRTNTLGSRRISSASASRIASRYVSSLLMRTHAQHKGHYGHKGKTQVDYAYRSPTASFGSGSGAF